MGASPSNNWARIGVLGIAGAVIAAGATRGAASVEEAPVVTVPVAATAPPVTEPPSLSPLDGIGRPWGSEVEGLLTFRGNPTRTFHGTGPVPSAPTVAWRYPKNDRMCSMSTEYNETRQWCGTGWTGQPAVFERDGRTWVVFGAYDAKIHFVDAETGADLLPPLETGDLAKGAVTVDPDGYPLIYVGSRDNLLRVIAIDRDLPTVLWSLDSTKVGQTYWNDDWDAAPLVLNGYLLEGGENSRLHAITLNRGYDRDGKVTAEPSLAWSVPGWDQQLLDDLGDHRVSLESSVTVVGDIAYLASSGGLVQGWDVSGLRTGPPGAPGEPTRVFRYWTGDDTDATIVADDEGMLYVGVEVDRATDRSAAVGQLLKLDPTAPTDPTDPTDPVVWSVRTPTGEGNGTWSTPAIVGDTVIWPTKPGKVYGLDRATGATLWTLSLPGPIISSPDVVDGTLVIGDGTGVLHAYALGDGRTAPTVRWTFAVGGTIESTAAIWKGSIYLGTRDGQLFALRDG